MFITIADCGSDYWVDVNVEVEKKKRNRLEGRIYAIDIRKNTAMSENTHNGEKTMSDMCLWK